MNKGGREFHWYRVMVQYFEEKMGLDLYEAVEKRHFISNKESNLNETYNKII